MTPSELHTALTEIIAQETGCSVSWAQHEQSLSKTELSKIMVRSSELFLKAFWEFPTPESPQSSSEDARARLG